MRVGPHGLLQPFADALKLLQGRHHSLRGGPVRFLGRAADRVIAAFTVFTVVPFGPYAGRQ
jgi:NADH:ubiquinone oxidoreductase subunit H